MCGTPTTSKGPGHESPDSQSARRRHRDRHRMGAVRATAGRPHWVEVASISAQPIGAGNVSDTVRIGIEYARAESGSPAAVVVKFRPSAPGAHAHGLRSGAYHREIGAYREVGGRQACRIPRCFWVAGDETNINLVLEDLTATTTPGNQAAGCGVAEAESLVAELARLHSSFFPLTDEAAPACWCACPRSPTTGAMRRNAGPRPR